MNRTVFDDHSSLTIIDRFIYAPGFIFGPLNFIMCILFTILCISDRKRFHPNFCILRIHLIIAFYINAITHIIITTVIFVEGLALPVKNYTLWFISVVLGGGVATEILRFLWISIFIERCVATFYSDVYENQVKRFIWLPIMLTIFVYTAAIFSSYLKYFCAFIPGYAIYSLLLCFDSVGVILIYVLHRLNKQKRRLKNDSDVKLTQRYQIVENIKVLKIIFPIFTTGVFFTLFGTLILILTTQIQPLTFLFRYTIVLYYIPSATSYTDHTSQFSQIFVYTFAFLMLIEFFLIIFFNILILLSIKSTSKLVTSKTFRLQLSFYKTLFINLIDSIFVILFIWVPIFISPIIVIFKISDFRVGILGFNSSIIGAPISYLLNMVLIKPYRRFFISIFGKILRKEISETSVTKVQAVQSKLFVSRSK